MPVAREDNTSKVAKEFLPTGSNTAHIRRNSFVDAAAASATAVHAAMSAAALVTTGITNPTYARNVSVVGAGSGHNAAGDVIINGTDIRGAVISETLTLNGDTSVPGAKAFKTITSIDLRGVTGIDANNTVTVGIGVKFGLDRKMDSDGVLKATVGGAADSALPTVAFSASAISGNTVQFATAPNASRDYIVTFATNEVYAPN